MRFLDEHRRRPAALADHLPWAALVAPGVVLNKDGSFMAGFRFRGPDLESSTEDELMAVIDPTALERQSAAVRTSSSLGWSHELASAVGRKRGQRARRGLAVAGRTGRRRGG